MRLLAVLLVSAAVGCADGAPDDGAVDDWCEGKCDAGQGAARLLAPDLIVTDPAVLADLEGTGLGLAAQLGGSGASTQALGAASRAFRQVREAIGADLAAIDTDDPLAGVGMAYTHRLFDAKWLDSSAARFRLVSIVNRMDLAHQTPGACGELRLVYRLEYQSAQGVSRLPMTVMVVREQVGGASGCAGLARAWQAQRGSASDLRLGPLDPLGDAVRLEINLQSVRWPSAIRKDMGGHAEYLLRVFELDGDAAVAAPLPNTVATDLDATERAELAAWIGDNLDAIERGDAVVPERFLARSTVSVSPRGLARGANRPFLTTFPRPEQTFGALPLSGYERIGSPGALVRRLDTMTCQGCHQTRGMAGFHILGQDPAGLSAINSLVVPASPHLIEELRWRRDALAAIADASTLAEPRPAADRDPRVPGRYGAHCGLGDPGFAAWTCAAGLQCADVSGEEVGLCVDADGPGAGEACELATVSFEADPHRDRVTDKEELTCDVPGSARATCSDSDGGFPNGACSGACSKKGVVNGDAICGAAPPEGFNDCMGANRPFDECMANAGSVFRRRCDAATPCGDDYVCSGVPGAAPGVGACMPPYFIFQARVDGHRVPQ